MGFEVHKSKPSFFARGRTWVISIAFLAAPVLVLVFFSREDLLLDRLAARDALARPAAYALGLYGCKEKARQPLRDALAQDGAEDPALRATCAWALGRARSKDVTADLEDAARKDPAPVVRAAAVRALGTNGDPGAADTVERAFKDPDPTVRLAACVAAGELKDTIFVPRLLERLGEHGPDLRVAAAEALHAISGKDFGEDERAWRAHFGR
jgi:hypothetical protein